MTTRLTVHGVFIYEWWGGGLLRQAESRQKVVLGSERLHRDNQDDVELN